MKNKNLYIILGLLGVGGLIWYFKRKQTSATSTTNTNKNTDNKTKGFDIDLTSFVSPIVSNVMPSTTTVDTTVDNLTTMNTNYLTWLQNLVDARMRTSPGKFTPITFQPTKETQPLPSDATGKTIPLTPDFVFIWQEFDNNMTRPIDLRRYYNNRWVIINKNQIQ